MSVLARLFGRKMDLRPQTKEYTMNLDRFAHYRKKGALPERYEEGMNCFLETIHDPALQQATYEELRNMPPSALKIEPTDEFGSLFGVTLVAAMDAYNRAAQRLGEDQSVLYGFSKKALIGMILEDVDIELTVFQTNIRGKYGGTFSHAEKVRTKDFILESEIFFKQGFRYHKSGEREEALRFYNEAIKAEPLDARAWLNKGVILSERQDYDKANKCFDEVIAIAPKMAEGAGWINKAVIASQMARWDEAIKYLDKALEINTANSWLWNEKAIVLGRLGNFDSAN